MSARKRNKTRELETMVADCVEQFGIPEPGVFLAHIMAGVDPRKNSSLISLLRTLSKRHPDTLPSDAWQTVRALVDVLPVFDTVDIDMSTSAARALMPYLHAKRQEIEMSGGLTHSDLPVVNPTDEQLDAVVEKLTKDI